MKLYYNLILKQLLATVMVNIKKRKTSFLIFLQNFVSIIAKV